MARVAGRKRVSTDTNDEVNVLQLSIHGVLIGYLAGFKNGRNVLSIADTFKNNPERPTFSLITHPNFPNTAKLMAEPWAQNQRLHPVLSNLLPDPSCTSVRFNCASFNYSSEVLF